MVSIQILRSDFASKLFGSGAILRSSGSISASNNASRSSNYSGIVYPFNLYLYPSLEIDRCAKIYDRSNTNLLK